MTVDDILGKTGKKKTAVAKSFQNTCLQLIIGDYKLSLHAQHRDRGKWTELTGGKVKLNKREFVEENQKENAKPLKPFSFPSSLTVIGLFCSKEKGNLWCKEDIETQPKGPAVVIVEKSLIQYCQTGF